MIKASGSKFEIFKDFSLKYSDVDSLRRKADELFSKKGEGREAVVYSVGSDKVLKISSRPLNLRAEYISFFNPKYKEVTPDVYDHHPDWKWILVEKVRTFRRKDWLNLWKHLPTFSESIALRNRKRYFDVLFLELSKGNIPDWFEDLYKLGQLSDKEYRFFMQIAELHQDLGLNAGDIRPENLGVDSDGNLVIIDIFTLLVGNK